MTLTTITPQLYKARAGSYAIPLFDVFEMQGARGIFDAISRKKSPAIIAIYSQMIDLPDAGAFSAYLRTMAETVDVPVSVMLDHGTSVEQCIKAISFGFTDVMFDGSSLALPENMLKTREVVSYAHERGIGVEAELGHVGTAGEYEELASKKKGFTDPESVSPFIEATGVDFLAVAFGTAHGIYLSEPHLDLDLVKTIAQKVTVPLVMHGGSGLSDDQFQQAIAAGIAKINIATHLVVQSTADLKKTAAETDANLFKMMGAVSKAYAQGAGYYLDLFSATGKGD